MQFEKPLVILFALVILISFTVCEPPEEADTKAFADKVARLQSEKRKLEERQTIIARLATEGEPGIWTLDWINTAQIFEPHILERYPDHQAIAENVVNGLNHIRPAPGIEYVAQSGATVHLRIKDRDFLTQRMGSAGAQQYLGSIVISLTSLPGVALLKFDFFEGDHAAPGFYSRASFIR